MAQIIRLKRHIGSALTPTAGTGATQLSVGELAYERQQAAGAPAGPDNLYVSDGVAVHPLVSAARQVELTGAQTITGVKTYSNFPVFPAGTANQVLQTTDAAGTLAWTAPITVPPALILKGEFDASSGTTGVVVNAVAPLTNGALPASAPANQGFFVIVTTEGTPTTGNAPHDHLAVGDWIVSTGTSWIHINLHFAIVAAENVSVTSLSPLLPAGIDNVQDALEALVRKGGTMGATDPVTGMQAGDLFFNTTSNTLKIYSGGVWTAVIPPAAAATVVADLVSIEGNGAATGTYPATGPLQVALVDGGTYV